MKKLALGVLCAGLLVATGCGGDEKPHIRVDAGSGTGTCSPLTQAGCGASEKCTWIVDAIMPQYVGHIGCAPAGDVDVGGTCMFGPPGTTGYDNCKTGSVCNNYRPGSDGNFLPGFCKAICDQTGGMPGCDAQHTCVAYSGLFLTSDTTPPAAGVCDQQCDPFADNDWDGVMGPYTRTGTTCREDEGCYGFPDRGTVPKTAFSCTRDVNAMKQQPTGLRHRVQCLEGDPADPSKPRCRTAAGVYPNGCNQGYEPILHESSTTTTAVCLAMCEPLDCYAGSCGTADDARFGKSPNRCNALDRVGEFNGDLNTTPHPNGDTCQRLWRQEVDMSGHFEISDRGDTLGFCIDNSKYQYDSDGDNMVDMVLPPCGALQKLGTHMDTDKTNPTVYWGAADFGCVPHADAGLFNGKGTVPAATMRVWNSMDTWRLPYNAMATPD